MRYLDAILGNLRSAGFTLADAVHDALERVAGPPG
jgi:hypothetical protein